MTNHAFDVRLDFFLIVFVPNVVLRDAFLRGTFNPASRASSRAMAIACFLSVTLCPDPLFRSPSAYSCITLAIFFRAAFDVFAMVVLR